MANEKKIKVLDLEKKLREENIEFTRRIAPIRGGELVEYHLPNQNIDIHLNDVEGVSWSPDVVNKDSTCSEAEIYSAQIKIPVGFTYEIAKLIAKKQECEISDQGEDMCCFIKRARAVDNIKGCIGAVYRARGDYSAAYSQLVNVALKGITG